MDGFFSDFIDLYSLAMAVGAAVSFVALFFISKEVGLAWKQTFKTLICALIGLFIGAHILFLIVRLPELIKGISAVPLTGLHDLSERIYDSSSGMFFYGGLYGYIAGTAIYCKTSHLYRRAFMNVLAAIFPLYQIFGKIGCSLAGCCYGIEYHGIFAMQFREDQIATGISDDLADFTRFPVQPLEAVIGLIFFLIILMLLFKTGTRYSLITLYLSAFAVMRFFTEFLRADDYRGIWGPFSTSQWISLGTLIGLGIYFTVKYYRLKKYGERGLTQKTELC